MLMVVKGELLDSLLFFGQEYLATTVSNFSGLVLLLDPHCSEYADYGMLSQPGVKQYNKDIVNE